MILPERPWRVFCILAALSAAAATAQAADDAGSFEFFESKIRPILVDNCYKCHSQTSEKVKGGLLLDTRDGLLKGGDTGPAIKPGHPDESLLIKAVRYADEDLQMPPKGKKLSSEQIADLETWVRLGAPDPRTNQVSGLSRAEAIAAKARTHWAFQPVEESPVPVVRNKRWIQTPVDNFILARLDAKGLTPSQRADKRTLIRRAYFDLIGLPPSPEEVSEFLANGSPDAFARLVDKLLASPHYGERWGRHWLDVARYADTKGYVFEEDRHYPYSYTYRDYVIRAFNEDLPYDEFIKEQIAADLMPLGDDKRPLAALGYLTLGRRFVNNIHDIIDDRIDVVTRGMMGLTVACARCHDHKYDPIPTKDYYSLYGVFDSSMEPEEEPLLGTKPDAKAFAEYEAEHKKREEERRAFRAQKEAETAEELRQKAGDYLLTSYEARDIKDNSKVDSFARKQKLDGGVVRRWLSSLDGWKKNSNSIFVPWFAFASIPETNFAAGANEVTSRLHDKKDEFAAVNPQVLSAFAGDPPVDMKEVAARYGKLFNDVNKDWRNAQAATNSPAPAALPDPGAEAIRQVLYADDAPDNPPRHEFDRLFDVPTIQKLRALKRRVDELDATHPGAPARATALVDRNSPHNVQVFVRGSADNRGPEVPRQFLEVLAGPNRQPFKKGSGRLELAEAIARRDNPLTARVLVNRVWMHHFGSPLVSTPSDFGLRSDPPTHPELLDYLATRFMDDGWSIKKLHRLILLSSAWQQSSADNPAAERIDPGNQLLWRMNRQRLEFEPMRDTLLAVAEKLDLTIGGHAVDITSEPFSTRRTVYGYIDRQNLPGLFRAFDLASPDNTSPRRFYTTVPQQALFLMNSPFVVEQARNFVDRPEFRAAATEQQRVRLIYQLAFQRDPTRDELNLAHEFTHAAPPPPALTMATNWVFGYGAFDEKANRVKSFHKLPYFDGQTFQGGPALPDPKIGRVLLNGAGGHPGNDQQHAAIRRWIAPRDGVISISGTLTHAASEGDGVRGRIVSSKSGALHQWLVHHAKEETIIDRVEVNAGDKIDFVTDCNGTVDYDSFGWSPVIRFLADGKTIAGQRMEWNASKDFEESARTMHPSLDVWERYAQVILLANELVFID
jgi:mono/diheme cytochrome c family protein